MSTEPKFADDKAVPTSVTGYENFAYLGTSGLNRDTTYVYEEFLTKLRWPGAAKIYQEMADNDATIGAVFYLAKQLVRKASWSVTAASDEDDDKFYAEFVEQCMHDMSMTWSDLICEILSMFTYGWSFHEVIYKMRKGPMQKDGKFRSKYNDGLIGWRNIPGRSQHTLEGWQFAEDGGPVAMIQWAPPDYKRVVIPFSKGLLFRTETTRNNPEGKSLLRNAYRSWYFKKRIEEIEGIGIERDLAGLPVLQPPEGVDIWDKQNPVATALRGQSEQIVRNIRRDTSEGVVIPFGWDLKLLSTGGTRQFDTNAIINRYDQRIAITMLSDIVMLGADKVGSFALADVKRSMLATSIEAQILNIAEIFNKYAIPTLMEINNFKCPNGYPRLVPSEIDAVNLEDVAKILKASGLDIYADIELYNYVRDLLELDKVNSETFKELQQAKLDMTAQLARAKAEGKQATGATGGAHGEDYDQTERDPFYDKDSVDASLDI